MIPSCPDSFWHDVAKLVADRIMIRESSLAAVNFAAVQSRPTTVSVVGGELQHRLDPAIVAAGLQNTAAGIAKPDQVQRNYANEPPEGPRAA